MAARYLLDLRRTLRTRPNSGTVKMQSMNLVLAVALGCLAAHAQDQTGKFGPVGPGPATQRKGAAPQGPTPKMPDGKPDFSGVWTPVNFFGMGQPSLTPW